MTHTLRTEYDIPLTVEYRITAPPLPPRTYGPPERCYPAEPAEFEIVRVLIGGAAVPFDALPDAVQMGIEEQIEIAIPDDIEGDADAAAEYRAELRRDDL